MSDLQIVEVHIHRTFIGTIDIDVAILWNSNVLKILVMVLQHTIRSYHAEATAHASKLLVEDDVIDKSLGTCVLELLAVVWLPKKVLIPDVVPLNPFNCVPVTPL